MDGGPPPPPPPPPHGRNPKSAGLPDGNYDIFIIPPHSAGGGFLYLPSLKPQANSYIAGCLSGALITWLSFVVTPVIKSWWRTVSQSGGGVGVLLLVLAVGAAGWAWGQQKGFGAGLGGDASGGRGDKSGSQQQQAPPPRPDPHQSAGPGYQSPPHNGYQQSPPHGAGPNYGPQPGNTYSQDHQHHQHPGSPPPHNGPDPFERYGRQKAKTQPPASEADGDDRPKPRARAYSNASSSWHKAREETKRREDERRKAEDDKRASEADKARKDEAERAARAAAEKEKWEKMRAREREIREREAREKIARERLQKEKDRLEKERQDKEKLEKEIQAKIEKEIAERLEKERVERERKDAEAEKEARFKAAKERIEKAKSEAAAKSTTSAPVYGVGERINPYSLETPKSMGSPRSHLGSDSGSATPKAYERPTAKSYLGTNSGTSQQRRPAHYPSAESMASSDYSWAPSHSTAPTESSASPPAKSYRGPYKTSDPDKVVIKGVYQFSDGFPKPIGMLVAGEDGMTDGLVLRITSEGMFVDDDVKGVGLRQWDVKAWTMKGVESTTLKASRLHVVRATIRDAESKKYLFVIPEDEAWKVVQGLQRLKQGTQVRSFGLTTLAATEATRLMAMLGYA